MNADEGENNYSTIIFPTFSQPPKSKIKTSKDEYTINLASLPSNSHLKLANSLLNLKINHYREGSHQLPE